MRPVTYLSGQALVTDASWANAITKLNYGLNRLAQSKNPSLEPLIACC